MSRKVEGSNGYQQARRVFAKHQATIANRRHPLTLRDRTLTCECGLTIGRDHHAAINIKSIGSSMGYQSGHKPKVRLRSRVDGTRPVL
ncbi:MAG: hypothetical protein ABI947_28205 [Chloroflexota bacterium]